ncbi:MAG TPA: phospholipase D-like domain-containing protein [Pseudolabrys sp.]|nr:phospholipase D-like domain-containing protein [Pseudolabrys sp.]
MAIEICVRAGSDDAFIAWSCDFLANCRGFALRRRIKHANAGAVSPNAESGPDAEGRYIEIVASWVGFAAGPDVPAGTRQPTTVWPIQKYLWSDFAVRSGDEVAYQVTPMVGPWNALQAATAEASGWSDTVVIGSRSTGKISCFFNRGIVASQWLSRLLPSVDDPKKDSTLKAKSLNAIIAKPGDTTRNFLAGPLRAEMIELLTSANKAKSHIYAALFELDDPELIPLLTAFGKRAHVLLGNGSVKKKGEDENATARVDLKRSCTLFNRFSAPRALAHNKFLVICDGNKPRRVWTGSTNWTKTGLCTQSNNGLLIDNPDLAQDYLDQWNTLRKAGDASPETLKTADETPHKTTTAKGVTLWFTPMGQSNDLEQAGALIAAAKEGILFLMFNPGPRGSLLNDIIELASPASPNYNPDLYIQGVVNQNPGTAKNPVVLFNRGDKIGANADVVLPAAIDRPSKFFRRELLKLPTAHAMVHSKVVVIDPYGKHPVVMTGSHNMGPKASTVNDENFVIVEGNGALASQYATKIMEVYNQYRWRASQKGSKEAPRWTGLADTDHWQIGAPGADAKTVAYDKRRLRELDFWFGTR